MDNLKTIILKFRDKQLKKNFSREQIDEAFFIVFSTALIQTLKGAVPSEINDLETQLKENLRTENWTQLEFLLKNKIKTKEGSEFLTAFEHNLQNLLNQL